MLRQRRVPGVALGLLCSALAGCVALPRTSVVKEEAVLVQPLPAREPNGSIYQARRGLQPLFEDRRPRMSGDTLTIVLNEQVSASKNSASNANRSGVLGFGAATTSARDSQVGSFGLDASTNNDFVGGGGSQATNSFTGTIAVAVMEVLPNGNLRVRGEKQIAINQGTEYIRFSGVVNPRTITGDNTVSSTQVSEARIEYVGDGYINESQRIGWIQRFFFNVSPL